MWRRWRGLVLSFFPRLLALRIGSRSPGLKESLTQLFKIHVTYVFLIRHVGTWNFTIGRRLFSLRGVHVSSVLNSKNAPSGSAFGRNATENEEVPVLRKGSVNLRHQAELAGARGAPQQIGVYGEGPVLSEMLQLLQRKHSNLKSNLHNWKGNKNLAFKNCEWLKRKEEKKRVSGCTGSPPILVV